MEEIEVSSRLFHDQGAVFMTATLPAQTDSANVLVAPVTFVLTTDRAAHRRARARKGDLLSNVRDSLMTFERLFGFFSQTTALRGGDPTVRARVKSLVRDGRSLSAHASFLSQKNTFLLDANMPELRWVLGYPAALVVMALSAIVPFWYSRRRGWL